MHDVLLHGIYVRIHGTKMGKIASQTNVTLTRSKYKLDNKTKENSKINYKDEIDLAIICANPSPHPQP